MASLKSVIVLTPNGRRQNVKVTPNTTILQILEEVCKKQGFKAEEYDVKHHNKVLDVSSIIRFSGLPNNAQLEMCAIQKLRAESPVTLGLQLENGTRLTGDYLPSDNLLNILKQLCPDELNAGKHPVVLYMRQEIYGEALQNTSLKSLGLTGGRAMFRIVNRKPEELGIQANVSAPLPSKPPEEKPYIRKVQRVETVEAKPEIEPIKIDANSSKPNENRTPSPTLPKEKSNFVTDFIKREKSKKTDNQNIDTKVKISDKVEILNEDFAFLGARSALAFSLDMAQTVPHEDLPDEFFDLTLKDARKLLRDLKQKRVQLEENPLQTSALRNFEQDKKILRQLHQHKKSVIRIQFPDRTVLQGTFKPLETIQVVKDFVKEYLENSPVDFHLYTTPPKCILDPETSLLDSGCVPSIVVHFGLDIPVTENYKYLKENLFSKFITPSLASLAASRSRGDEPIIKDEEQNDMDVDDNLMMKPNLNLDVNDEASTSGVGTSYPSPPEKYSGPKEKVPKWFKPSK